MMYIGRDVSYAEACRSAADLAALSAAIDDDCAAIDAAGYASDAAEYAAESRRNA